MKADEQLKCKDCDWCGNCQYYNNRKETSQICKMFNNTWKFVEELEEIKAELQTEKDKSNNTYYAMKSVGLSTAIKIIDKRIAELKGENNEDSN